MRAGIVALAVMGTASAGTAGPAKERKLDKVKALEAAKAGGLRKDIIVPYPVSCPNVAKATGDIERLASNDPLGMNLDGLLREDIGVPELVAFAGPPVLCDHEEGSLFMSLFLAGKHGDVQLETRDGDLIGVILTPEPPAKIDLGVFKQRFGVPQRRSSNGGESAYYSFETADFKGGMIFQIDAPADKGGKSTVSQVIVRRRSMLTVLPESYVTESDVKRLVSIALAAKAPAINDFYGPFGALENGRGNQVTVKIFTGRNLAKAALVKTTIGKNDWLRSFEVTFDKPVPITAEVLVGAAGKTTRNKPKVSTKNGVTTIAGTTGTVTATFLDGALTKLAISRR